MALPPSYPPYQQPIIAAGGRVSTPWHRFFLSLVATVGGVVSLPAGSVPIATLAPIASPRLLGRGTVGPGPVQELFVGTGLALTGTTLAATADSLSGVGYWTPISNGNPLAFELLYTGDTGACVVGFVPTEG